MYFVAFRVNTLPNIPLEQYTEFLTRYTDSTPGYEGTALDGSDVWYPGAQIEPHYPRHYNKTYVHFLPGGYLNGHTVSEK